MRASEPPAVRAGTRPSTLDASLRPLRLLSVEGGRLVAARVKARPAAFVHATAAIWSVGFAIGAGVQYHLFLLRRYDLGNFTQAIWSTAHGRFLHVTEVGGAEVSRLGIHVDPIILLLVPLWRLWPTPILLLAVQALALGAGALPLYRLAQKKLGSEGQAALLAAAYLLSPAVCWNAAQEFHAVALAVPLLLACIWFLDEGRLGRFAIAAGLAVSCQEQIGLIVGCLGLWYAWRGGRRLAGIGIAIAGSAVSAVEVGLVLHRFSDGSPFYGRYAGVGGSLTGIAGRLLADPASMFGHLLRPANIAGIAMLVIPVAGLCFRSSVILAASPQVALLVLSDRPGDWDFSGQTVLPIVPFVYAATVFALSRPTVRTRWAAAHVLVAATAMAVLFGPFAAVGHRPPTSAHLSAEREALAMIPPSAPVSATNHLGAHLAARERLDVFPVLRGASWVAVDVRDYYLPDMAWLKQRSGIAVDTRDLYPEPRLMRRALRQLDRSARWKHVFSSDDIEVFRRVPSGSTLKPNR